MMLLLSYRLKNFGNFYEKYVFINFYDAKKILDTLNKLIKVGDVLTEKLKPMINICGLKKLLSWLSTEISDDKSDSRGKLCSNFDSELGEIFFNA